jgi:hypothetical protein
MEDIYQEIIMHINEVDTLKHMYFVNKKINRLLDSLHINSLLSLKFHTHSINFKDFVNNIGMLTIPRKSKHRKEGNGSYFTHNNGDKLFNIRVVDNRVTIHTEGWEQRSDEDSDDWPIEGERCYKAEPLLALEPENIFIGRDPFNNHDDIKEFYNYNPNHDNDPTFVKIIYSDDDEDNIDEDDDVEIEEAKDIEAKNEEKEDVKEEVLDAEEKEESEALTDIDSAEWEFIENEYNKGYYFNMDRTRFDGSNNLIHIKNLDYIFIDRKVYSFTAIAKIVNFISCEGNNDVPYAHAVDEYNNIYLFTTDKRGIVVILMTNEL